jgi:hypothetical protein
MRTSPEPPEWRNGFAYHSMLPMTAPPKRQRRRAQCRDDSFKSLVHREGFEPSYLRGGADLQSAGFNHSPTCAELQNSPAFAAYFRLSSQIFTPACTEIVQTDFAKVRIFANVRTEMRAKKLSHANTTLGKFPYGVPLENLLSRRAAYPASGTDAGAGEGI